MPSDPLIDRTRSVFPQLETAPIAIEPLLKGGSDRRYYRMRMSEEHSMILVKYGGQVEENDYYVAIDRFLESLGVRVPTIFFHDETECLIWMEDLGSDDLYAHRDEPWEIRRSLYCRALDEILKLHFATPGPLPDGLRLQHEFTEGLYRWEQGYFFDQCLGGHFGLDPVLLSCLRILPPLRAIPRRLARKPRRFVHRDFQSQNIILLDGEACLIDFQGLRPGLPPYDLASLLYDPYVSLGDEERRELLDYYIAGAIDAGARLSNEFEEIYELCALQRLMQALGAYGFLGHVRGREDFLAHIPVAMASLREIVERLGTLPDLLSVLKDCD